MTTVKVGSAGRFGSRYGVYIRKRVVQVEKKQQNLAPCPFCGFSKIKREAAGLFECRKCNAKFTGGAYETETLIGKAIKKMVLQKSFIADSAELLKAEEMKESSFSDIEKAVEQSMGEERISENKKKKKKDEAA